LITALNTDDPWRKNKLEGKKPKDTQKESKPEKPKESKPEKPKESKFKKTSKSKTKETKD
jgi:large subunit ribosomal protein L24